MNFDTDARLLYISSIDVSLTEGPSINEREFILGLQEQLGDRAYILIPEPLQHLAEIESDQIILTRGYDRGNPLSYFLHQRDLFERVDSLMRRQPFDFLVLRLSPFPLAHYWIVKKCQIPYAVKTLGTGVLDGIKRKNGRTALLGSVLSPVNKALIRTLARRACVVDVCTEALKEHLQARLALNPTRLHWVDNSTNTERFRPRSLIETRERFGFTCFDPIIGLVGGAPWEQGGLQMLRVAPSLLAQFPDLGIVIAGDGYGMNQLHQEATVLGIEDRCKFPGLVPYDHVPYLINTFDVCISFDTIKRIGYLGNSSQKVRQYLACGKPVVSGLGGNTFLVEQGLGSIVSGDDLEGIREAILHWLTLGPDERKEFVLKATAFAKQNLSIAHALRVRLDLWSQFCDY